MDRNPLVRYPDISVKLPPVYCGSVRHYAVMAQYGAATVDVTRRFNKRDKDCHRCLIEGPNGVQRLTVPVEKPQAWTGMRLSDVRVSTHGDWWHVHWGAICSAYGRTPYFEFYADDLMPAFSGETELLVDLDATIDRFCRSALGISDGNNRADIVADTVADMTSVKDVPYYQIWASRFGFTPGLSVLDLIFNMGPEAPLVLREMAI